MLGKITDEKGRNEKAETQKAVAPATSDVIFCSDTDESTENLCADFWQLAASFDASVSAQNIVPSTANAEGGGGGGRSGCHQISHARGARTDKSQDTQANNHKSRVKIARVGRKI